MGVLLTWKRKSNQKGHWIDISFAGTTTSDGGQFETIFVQIGRSLVYEVLQTISVTPGRSYKDHRES